jgi:hypothetical protein
MAISCIIWFSCKPLLAQQNVELWNVEAQNAESWNVKEQHPCCTGCAAPHWIYWSISASVLPEDTTPYFNCQGLGI